MRCQIACLQQSFVCFLAIFANNSLCHDIIASLVQEIDSFSNSYNGLSRNLLNVKAVRTGSAMKNEDWGVWSFLHTMVGKTCNHSLPLVNVWSRALGFLIYINCPRHIAHLAPLQRPPHKALNHSITKPSPANTAHLTARTPGWGSVCLMISGLWLHWPRLRPNLCDRRIFSELHWPSTSLNFHVDQSDRVSLSSKLVLRLSH